jgi:hypothetical protein
MLAGLLSCYHLTAIFQCTVPKWPISARSLSDILWPKPIELCLKAISAARQRPNICTHTRRAFWSHSLITKRLLYLLRRLWNLRQFSGFFQPFPNTFAQRRCRCLG